MENENILCWFIIAKIQDKNSEAAWMHTQNIGVNIEGIWERKGREK